MKTKFLLMSVLVCGMPLTMAAQDDDLYFTPKKSVGSEMPSSYDRPAYYCGSSRDVDEYNRRGKLKSYYQKIGTDSLGNDIIEFHAGDGKYGVADTDSTITIYPGSERYYDDADPDFAYSRRMGRFDGFYGYYDPYYYGSYWGTPYWRGYYGWYDPWYGPYYYSSWYDPWYYGYHGWGYPYYGWAGGWGAPYWHYSYNGPSGTRNHSVGNGRFFGSRSSFSNTVVNPQRRGFGDNSVGNFGSRNNNRRSSFDDNRNRTNRSQFQQNNQRSTFGNPASGFGSRNGNFGGGGGFGGNRGSFGGGASRGGFGGRR